MIFMLDTNICAAITKSNENVINAIKANYTKGLYISVITLAEIQFGIQNSSNPIKYRDALIKLLTLIKVLPFDELAALAYGEIRSDLKNKGRLIGNMDLLIAAHAKSCEAILVTNNTREFNQVEGLAIEDWTVVK